MALWTVWAVAVVLSVTVAVLTWASAVQSRQRAESAADLAALSGARAQVAGADGCERAARVALANRARLKDCTEGPGGVEVVVEVPVLSGPLAQLDMPPARAKARAGVPP